MRPRRAITSAIVVGGMIWGGARLVPRASSPPQASQRMETSPVRPRLPAAPVRPRLPAAVQSNQRGHHRRSIRRPPVPWTRRGQAQRPSAHGRRAQQARRWRSARHSRSEQAHQRSPRPRPRHRSRQRCPHRQPHRSPWVLPSPAWASRALRCTTAGLTRPVACPSPPATR